MTLIPEGRRQRKRLGYSESGLGGMMRHDGKGKLRGERKRKKEKGVVEMDGNILDPHQKYHPPSPLHIVEVHSALVVVH
jgi:hypothetical protein